MTEYEYLISQQFNKSAKQIDERIQSIIDLIDLKIKSIEPHYMENASSIAILYNNEEEMETAGISSLNQDIKRLLGAF